MNHITMAFFPCLTEISQILDIDIRLKGGPDAYSGRVEVYHNGEWGTVCNNNWGPSEADVACHQLGYDGAVLHHTGPVFGEGSGKIWMDNVACDGDENLLSGCSFDGWGTHNCSHSADASVTCCKATSSQSSLIVLL